MFRSYPPPHVPRSQYRDQYPPAPQAHWDRGPPHSHHYPSNVAAPASAPYGAPSNVDVFLNDFDASLAQLRDFPDKVIIHTPLLATYTHPPSQSSIRLCARQVVATASRSPACLAVDFSVPMNPSSLHASRSPSFGSECLRSPCLVP